MISPASTPDWENKDAIQVAIEPRLDETPVDENIAL